jgi:hypothetical protein
MNTAKAIKLIKTVVGKNQGRKNAVELAIDPNRWSSAVRTWVVEFQERERDESLPAFDSLFADAAPRARSKIQL